MAERDSTTMIKGEEHDGQLWRKLWRIRGLADILYCAASENENLPGASVEEVACMIYDLADEAQEDLEKCKTTKKEPPEASPLIELQ